MAKTCPVCGKDTWDYDVIEGVDAYCGTCHWQVRHIAGRLQDCPTSLRRCSRRTWARAIALARAMPRYGTTDEIDVHLRDAGIIDANNEPLPRQRQAVPLEGGLLPLYPQA